MIEFDSTLRSSLTWPLTEVSKSITCPENWQQATLHQRQTKTSTTNYQRRANYDKRTTFHTHVQQGNVSRKYTKRLHRKVAPTTSCIPEGQKTVQGRKYHRKKGRWREKNCCILSRTKLCQNSYRNFDLDSGLHSCVDTSQLLKSMGWFR